MHPNSTLARRCPDLCILGSSSYTGCVKKMKISRQVMSSDGHTPTRKPKILTVVVKPGWKEVRAAWARADLLSLFSLPFMVSVLEFNPLSSHSDHVTYCLPDRWLVAFWCHLVSCALQVMSPFVSVATCIRYYHSLRPPICSSFPCRVHGLHFQKKAIRVPTTSLQMLCLLLSTKNTPVLCAKYV